MYFNLKHGDGVDGASVIDCIAYDYAAGEDYVCGQIRHGGPEEYWYFYPSAMRPLSCSDASFLARQLHDLNCAIKK